MACENHQEKKSNPSPLSSQPDGPEQAPSGFFFWMLDSTSQIFHPMGESGVQGHPLSQSGQVNVSSTDSGRSGDDFSTTRPDRVHGRPE